MRTTILDEAFEEVVRTTGDELKAIGLRVGTRFSGS